MSLVDAEYTVYGSTHTNVNPRRAFVLSDLVCGDVRGTLITEHPVMFEGKRMKLQRGQLIDAASLTGILASFTADAGGWLPPGAFYQSRQRIAWHVPAQVRRMAFTVEGHSRSLRVPWPNLVLIAHAGGGLQVLALAGGQTPEPKARVYHAPLMNLSDQGDLCFGNATHPPFALESAPAFEDALFRSRFTHVNHPHTLAGRGTTSNLEHVEFWQALHDAKARELPAKALRPMTDAKRKPLTLQQVLSS